MNKTGKQKQTGTASSSGATPKKLRKVERIVSKKIENGKLLYMVKYLNCPHSENTWEPVEHLLKNCPQFVQQYEEAEGPPTPRPVAATGQSSTTSSSSASSPVGFARGLEPESVWGVSDLYGHGELFALVEWKDPKIYDIVPALEVQRRCPELLIPHFDTIMHLKNGNAPVEPSRGQGQQNHESQ